MAGYLDFFKDLEVSGIIHGILQSIIAKQELEYPADIKAYLKDRQDKGLPFPNDYSKDPDQIQQIKHLLNGLYYVEQVFIKLEALPNKTALTIIGVPGLLDEAYKGCTYLTQAGADIMSVFQDEIGDATKYLGAVQEFVVGYLPGSDKAGKYPEYAKNVGRVAGSTVAQMAKGQGGARDYDAISSAMSTIPQYIETLRLELGNYAPTVKKHAPQVNYDKMEELNTRIVELAETMKDSTDLAHLLWNAKRVFYQISALVGDISQEVGYLDDSVQQLVLENLATLKFTILPQLFACADKYEVQFLCEGGRFSDPLMEQIKPLYEMIVANTRHRVKYQGEAEKLLKLEDERFLACRLAPIESKIRQSKLTLHQVNQALASVELCFNQMEYLIARNLTEPEIKAELRESFEFLKPYLTLLDSRLSDNVMEGDANWGNFLWDTVFRTQTNPTLENTESRLEALRSTLMQMKINENFKIDRHEKMRTSVHQRAHIGLLPYTAQDNRLEVRDDEVLRRRHILRKQELDISEQGGVRRPENLTAEEGWDLYAAYRDRLDEIERVEQAADSLLTSCHSKTTFIGNQLKFRDPHYEVCLNQEESEFNPSIMEINIPGKVLRYNLRQGKLEGGGKLYFMSLKEAERLGYRDCYVLERNQHQLHYIGEKGAIERTIPYKIVGETLKQVKVPEQFHVEQDKVFFKDGRELTFSMMRPEETEHKTHAILIGFEAGKLKYRSSVPSNAGCMLYFSSLEEAKRQKRKSCYVWDKDASVLSYIGPDGSSQTNMGYDQSFEAYLKTQGVHQEKLGFSYLSEERIKNTITSESGHVPMVQYEGMIPLKQLEEIISGLPNEQVKKLLVKLADGAELNAEEQTQLDKIDIKAIQNLLPSIAHELIGRRHIGKGPEKKTRIVNDSSGQLRAKSVYFKLSDGQLNYHTRTASKAGCNLYLMSLDEARKAGHVGCYVWNRHYKQMYYIAPDGRIQRNIRYDDTYLKVYLAFMHKRHQKTNVRYLTPEQIKDFITCKGGHRPVEVHQGSIALDQINCSLKKLTDTKQLTPYLSRIFAELCERGHVVDNARGKVIDNYATIQPFMMSASPERVHQEQVDASVVHAFMGMSGRAPVSELQQSLREFKAQLPEHKARLKQKMQVLEEDVEGCVISHEAPEVSARDASFLSADVVDFMTSAAPLEHKITDARKALFKLKIVLDTQDLPDIDRKKLECMKQRQAYALYHHQHLLDSFRKAHPQLDYDASNRSEKTALLYYAPNYKMQIMDDKHPPKEGCIQLRIQDKALHYKLRYYGQDVQGEIPLGAIKPRLGKYDEHTVLTPQTYASILDNIYAARADAILEDAQFLEADEALDLYQWYISQEKKIGRAGMLFDGWFKAMQDPKRGGKNREKIQEAYVRLQPVLMMMVSPDARKSMKNMESTFAYCQQHDVAFMFQEQQTLIRQKRDYYGSHATRLVTHQASVKALLPDEAPAPDASRKHHLLKNHACSEGLASLETSLADLTRYLNPALIEKCKTRAKTGVPFPEAIDVNHKLEEAHQVLAFKQLSNLVYYLKQVMLELEKMNTDSTQLAYVWHVVQGYLAVHQAIFLSFDLMENPHFYRLYQDILQQTQQIQEQVTGKVAYFEPTKKEYQSETPALSQVFIALNELPIQIKAFRQTKIDKYALKTSTARKRALHMAEKTDALILQLQKKVRLGEIIKVARLLRAVQKKMMDVAHATHARALDDLEVIRTKDMKEIMLVVDDLEDKYGLQPGLLANPVYDILDELSLGFMIPLVPMQTCIERMMQDGSWYKARIKKAYERQKVLRVDREEAGKKHVAIQGLLESYHETNTYAMSWATWRWMPWKEEDVAENLDHAYAALNDGYQDNLSLLKDALIANDKSQHVPYLKHRLNGCRLLFMTEKEAEQQNERDCLVWFYTLTVPPRPMLVYINSDGTYQEQILLANTFKFIQAVETKAGPKKEKPIRFTGEELTDLIANNRRFEIPPNVLPFQMTDELIDDLKQPLPNPTTYEERDAFDVKFKRMLPVIEQCKAYYQGLGTTAQTAIEASREQVKYLRGERKQYKQANEALKRNIYEDYYLKHVEGEIHADREKVEFYPVGYARDIKDYLLAQKKELFSLEKFDELRTKYKDEGAFDRYMKAQVCASKRMYDNKHLEAYKQLEEIQEAVAQFKAYLVKARVNYVSGASLFESDVMILAKEEVIRELEAIVMLELPPEKRVKEIQTYLLASNEAHLKTLSACQTQHQQGWNYLKQCLERLLIAIGITKLDFIKKSEALTFKARNALQKEQVDDDKSISTQATDMNVTDSEREDEDEEDTSIVPEK
jgi:hypothetical protein